MGLRPGLVVVVVGMCAWGVLVLVLLEAAKVVRSWMQGGMLTNFWQLSQPSNSPRRRLQLCRSGAGGFSARRGGGARVRGQRTRSCAGGLPGEDAAAGAYSPGPPAKHTKATSLPWPGPDVSDTGPVSQCRDRGQVVPGAVEGIIRRYRGTTQACPLIAAYSYVCTGLNIMYSY